MWRSNSRRTFFDSMIRMKLFGSELKALFFSNSFSFKHQVSIGLKLVDNEVITNLMVIDKEMVEKDKYP